MHLIRSQLNHVISTFCCASASAYMLRIGMTNGVTKEILHSSPTVDGLPTLVEQEEEEEDILELSMIITNTKSSINSNQLQDHR